MWRQDALICSTRGRGFHDLTATVQAWLDASPVRVGLLQLFLCHTSASLCITENADPAVREDLERFAARLAADGDPMFRHDTEGPDDMPAHVRSLLAGHSLTVPVRDGRVQLGQWQGIYLWEHRLAAMRREVLLTLQGESPDGG